MSPVIISEAKRSPPARQAALFCSHDPSSHPRINPAPILPIVCRVIESSLFGFVKRPLWLLEDHAGPPLHSENRDASPTEGSHWVAVNHPMLRQGQSSVPM